jgi:hypothetical protein
LSGAQGRSAFVGLDAHSERMGVTVLDQGGRVVVQRKMLNELLQSFLRLFDLEKVGLEVPHQPHHYNHPPKFGGGLQQHDPIGSSEATLVAAKRAQFGLFRTLFHVWSFLLRYSVDLYTSAFLIELWFYTRVAQKPTASNACYVPS